MAVLSPTPHKVAAGTFLLLTAHLTMASSNNMTFTPSFVETSHLLQKLKGTTHTAGSRQRPTTSPCEGKAH